MNLNSLRDVFHSQLKDMYAAEKQVAEALPLLMDAASSNALKGYFVYHLSVTQEQFETVRDMLDRMGVNPGNTKCEAIEGLIEETRDLIEEAIDPDARDAGLICMAQKAEHYEIATYGSLRTWALILGETDVARTLQRMLDQEYDADNTLDQLAEGYLNRQAKR
jgi:ferritin-like metal-binding protein YciE